MGLDVLGNLLPKLRALRESAANSFKRQELLAREAEHRLGHRFVNGAHTRWVIRQLEKVGKIEVAIALQAAFPDLNPGRPPKASLDPVTIQKLKRLGFSASALRQRLRDAWHGSATADEFLSRVSAHGMSIAIGETHRTSERSSEGKVANNSSIT